MKSTIESENVAVENVGLEELSEEKTQGQPLLGGNLDVIRDVKVKLDVKIGDAELTVAELFDLQNGSIIKMVQDVTAPVEISLDGKSVAHGELVVVGDNFGVRITDIKK